MTRLINLLGKKIGRWSVVGGPTTKSGQTLWECLCECGTRKFVYSAHLTRGKSLGCKKCAERKGRPELPWSMARICWHSMLARCTNPKHPHFANYFGRGIHVCERWKVFENFYEDMGPRPDGKTIERIDNNKGYSKENCRWASKKEQANNRRTNSIVEYKGMKYTITQLAEHIGLDKKTLRSRIVAGRKDLDAPVRRKVSAK